MRRIRPYLIVIVLLFFSIFIQGCGSNLKAPCPDLTSTAIDEDTSDALNVDVYFDGTPSMMGYVTPGPNTSYGQTITLFEQASTRSWPNGQISFFKFGNKIVKLNNRDYLMASTPSFYEYSEDFANTRIDSVLDSAAKQNLTVIVTDLFANESDTNLLNNKLKEDYLSKGLSVGIVGVKSEFNGTVYDLGIDQAFINYNSGNSDASRLRPFYILVMGKKMDVIDYIESLKESGLNKFPGTEFSLISKDIVSQLSGLDGVISIAKQNLASVNNLVEKAKNSNEIPQFRINKTESKASFNVKLKYYPLPYCRNFDIKKLETTIEAKTYKNGKLQNISNLPNAIAVKNVDIKGNVLSFDVELSVKNIPLDNASLFEISFSPNIESYLTPEWVTLWNMNSSKIQEWIQKPETFEGGTTINLERFINGLWQSNVQIHKPQIGSFCFFITKK